MIKARLVGLEVRGFRRFQEPRSFVFEGTEGSPLQTLVVAGANGSGKSTFLESILFCLGRDNLLHRQLERSHREHWFRDVLTTGTVVRVRLLVVTASGTILGTRAPCTLAITRSLIGWEIHVDGEPKPLMDDQSVIRSLLAELPVEWFSSLRQSYLAGPARPMADKPAMVNEETARLYGVRQSIIDERTRRAFSEDADNVEFQDEEWIRKLSAVWAALRGEDGTSFRVGRDRRDVLGRHFDLYLQRSSEYGMIDICSIDQLSTGEVEWLALAGTLITASTHGIVLIDEPELHLNSEWQSRVLPALRSVAPDAQLIMATHSDWPWDQVFSFERLLLLPDGDPRGDVRR